MLAKFWQRITGSREAASVEPTVLYITVSVAYLTYSRSSYQHQPRHDNSTLCTAGILLVQKLGDVTLIRKAVTLILLYFGKLLFEIRNIIQKCIKRNTPYSNLKVAFQSNIFFKLFLKINSMRYSRTSKSISLNIKRKREIDLFLIGSTLDQLCNDLNLVILYTIRKIFSGHWEAK